MNRSWILISFSFFLATVVFVRSDAENALPGRLAIAAVSNVASDRLGMNVSNIYYTGATTISPNLVAALTASGARWVRVNLLWGWTVEARRGNFDWKGLDDGIRSLRAAHLNVLMVLNGPVPCWAIPKQYAPGPSCTMPVNTIPNPQDWQQFVSTAVDRYRNQVTYWEVWNEPDLSSSISGPGITDNNRLSLYRDNILIPGAKALRATNPGAKVVAAVMSVNYPLTAPEANLTRALQTVLGNGAAKYIDAVSIHVYSQFDLVSYGNAARAAMKAAGLRTAQLWLTETGVREPPEVSGNLAQSSLDDQAAFACSQFAQALRSKVYDKVFWFALTDSTNFAAEHVDGYGLVRNNDYTTYPWVPRPALRTFAALAAGTSQCHN
jgi:hypothetical protein